jgi:protein-tyrosine phosphatase
MIDLHCHILPGVDDGPATMQEAIELARGASADGITTVAATPHVDHAHPGVDARRVRAAVSVLQERLRIAGVDVVIATGGEVAFTRALELGDAELRALTLGGAGWLLLECPLTSTGAPGFVGAARMLAQRGHRVLLAHPERSPVFLRSPELLDELVADGMLAQVTARALTGSFGRTVRDLAVELTRRGAAHVVASDGHGNRRPAKIADALAQARVEPSALG